MNAIPPGQRVPAGQPLDHRGRLRRDRRLRRRRASAGSSRDREATIVLVDHDRVEPHNLLRQNFYKGDVGGFKSQVLADRLARAYDRPIGYSVYPFREYDESRPMRARLPRPRRLRREPS